VRWLSSVAGVFVIFIVLWEAFETILLPRRVQARLLSSVFQKAFWRVWASGNGSADRSGARPTSRRTRCSPPGLTLWSAQRS
jgi:hypothetical protein